MQRANFIKWQRSGDLISHASNIANFAEGTRPENSYLQYIDQDNNILNLSINRPNGNLKELFVQYITRSPHLIAELRKKRWKKYPERDTENSTATISCVFNQFQYPLLIEALELINNENSLEEITPEIISLLSTLSGQKLSIKQKPLQKNDEALYSSMANTIKVQSERINELETELAFCRDALARQGLFQQPSAPPAEELYLKPPSQSF